MSSNLDATIKRLDKLAADYSRSPRDVAAASARAYTTAIRREIKSAAPGGRMRGIGKTGARVGVRYDIFPATTGSAVAYVQATGPLQLLERDTKPHTIPKTLSSRRLRTASGRLSKKRQTTGRQLSGRQFLGSQARSFTAMGPVTHPGTKGKHPFERGVRIAQRKALIDAAAELSRVFRGVFG